MSFWNLRKSALNQVKNSLSYLQSLGYWLSTSKEKVTGTSSLENNYGLCGKSKKIFSD